MARIILCLAIVAALTAPAAAQSGRISGTITDPSGAVLPAVDVRAVMRDGTGETTRTVPTDSKGSYRLDGLIAGTWVVTASVPGFETGTYRSAVQAGDSLDWSPTLQLGMLQETITVTTSQSPDAPRRYETPRQNEMLPAPRPAPAGTVRVGGSIKPPRKVVHVSPLYPPDAAAQGITGTVVLNAVIGSDGIVRDVTTARSPNDSLTLAATSAINGWEFTPTLLNGVPVDVRMTATFNFQQ